jgi:hypothetical protein
MKKMLFFTELAGPEECQYGDSLILAGESMGQLADLR